MIRVVRMLRWVLFFEGWLLLAAPAAILRWISYLESVFPKAAATFGQTDYFSFVCWTMGTLCLLTFWGQGLQKRWTRWTGLAVSLFNLAIFPPLGLTGLITIRRFTRFHRVQESDESSVVEETSSVRLMRATLTAVVLLSGYQWLENFAATLGVRVGVLGWQTLLALAGGQVVVSVIHDLGHTVAAKLLGFRFPVLRIGAWTWMDTYLTDEPGGGIQWNRIFAHDSYLAAVPADRTQVKSNTILIAAAGPLVSMIAALALLVLMLRSVGPPLANEGTWNGVLGFLFALDFSLQILPFGYSDGRILVDLISGNARGAMLVKRLAEASLGYEEIKETSDPLAPAAAAPTESALKPNIQRVIDPVLHRREALNRMLERGVSGGLQLVQSHQDLGIAEFLCGNVGTAREHLERSLELLSGFPDSPAKARAWMWLARLHRSQQMSMETQYAHGRAMHAWETERKSSKTMEALAQAEIALARLKVDQYEYDEAEELLDAIQGHPPKDPLQMALYHHVTAICGYRLRWQDRSRQHVKSALRILLSPKLDPKFRGAALLHMADLAWDLWLSGQAVAAAGVFERVIKGLETTGSCELPNYFRLRRAEILAKIGRAEDATEELKRLVNPSPEQERRACEVAGWASLAAGDPETAADRFDSAADTLDERERARLFVAEARALTSAGKISDASAVARAACDVLMKEEHGEAGVALLLLAAHANADVPDAEKHPFFEEGCRIVRSALLQPAPDKLLALRDLVYFFDAIPRPIESADLQEEMMRVLQQITWQTDDKEQPVLHESA